MVLSGQAGRGRHGTGPGTGPASQSAWSFSHSACPGGFSHCFFQVVGQEVDLQRVLIWVGPQPNLHQHLVGEGVTHHEAGVAHGAALVDQLALGQPDDQCPFFNKSTWGLMFAFSTAFSFRHLISLSMLKHLIYTQWHHLSSVRSVD